MNDDELESALRRYQMAGPPPELRAAVLARRVRLTRRDWAMAAAAAVLIAGAVVTRPAPPASTSQDMAGPIAQVEEVAAALGGGDEARAIAWMAVRLPGPAAVGSGGDE